jgi:hypothetical protein
LWNVLVDVYELQLACIRKQSEAVQILVIIFEILLVVTELMAGSKPVVTQLKPVAFINETVASVVVSGSR